MYALALSNLALCHDVNKCYNEALNCGLEAQNIFRDLGDHRKVLETVIENVNRYQKLVMFDKAIKMMEKHSALLRDLDGTDISKKFKV